MQNPIETMDLIANMGWEMDEIRNIWLRTFSLLNMNALNWLKSCRSDYNKFYN